MTISPSPKNDWYYVCGSWDGTTGTADGIELYRDGVNFAPSQGGNFTTPKSSDAGIDLTFGGRDSTGMADGVLDEVRISGVVRSAAWIEAEYLNLSDPGGFYGEVESNSSIPFIVTGDSVFYVGQPSTSLGVIDLTQDNTIISISSANDILISIPESLDMTFDSTVTTISVGGTASSKVNTTVTYEDDNTTVRISVTDDFVFDETLSISNLRFTNFNSVSTETDQLQIYTSGTISGEPAAVSDIMYRITGSLVFSNHTQGQVRNKFTFQNRTDETLFAFAMSPQDEVITIDQIAFTLTGANSIEPYLSNFRLYRDVNNNRIFDEGTDILVSETGSLTQIGMQTMRITFGESFEVIEGNYILVADILAPNWNSMATFSLLPNQVSITGSISAMMVPVLSTVSKIQHFREGFGSGGGRIGVQPPVTTPVAGGGQGGGGAIIDSDPGDILVLQTGDGEKAPTDHSEIETNGQWTNSVNAYISNDEYASSDSSGAIQDYFDFDFDIPSTNQITGIIVRLEASTDTGVATIDAQLSFNAGDTFTDIKSTQSLTTTDTIFILGSESDTWGAAVTPTSFANNNFELRLIARPNENVVRVDAIGVKVVHVAGDGDQGGGGDSPF